MKAGKEDFGGNRHALNSLNVVITKGVPLKRLSWRENKPVPKEPSIIDMDL